MHNKRKGSGESGRIEFTNGLGNGTDADDCTGHGKKMRKNER